MTFKEALTLTTQHSGANLSLSLTRFADGGPRAFTDVEVYSPGDGGFMIVVDGKHDLVKWEDVSSWSFSLTATGVGVGS